MTKASGKAPEKRAHQRSRVTNGSAAFVEGSERSAWARRFRDLVEAHVTDLGGSDALSEAQKSLIRRVATIECELERYEGLLSQGQEVSLDEYARAASHLRRLLETLGLRRVSKDVTPDLRDIARYYSEKR
jgi:hypothetical protein